MFKYQETQYYLSHEEKRRYFDLHVITSNSEFEHLFKELLPQKYKTGGIWRGSPESAYKLYNTFQRENSCLEEPIDDVLGFVKLLAQEFDIWDSKKITSKFFKNLGKEQVPLYSKLSFLRHCGIPSPLLDWTRDTDIALFFATNNFNRRTTKVISDTELSDYFSIYFMDKEHCYYQYNSKVSSEYFKSNSLESLEKRYHFFKLILPRRKKANSIFNNEKFIYEHIKCNPIQRISDECNDFVNHSTMTNLNIKAQNGLFILNMHPSLALEEAILDRASKMSNNDYLLKQAYDNHIRNFSCFDIHKKFIPQISENLKSKDINVIDNSSIVVDIQEFKQCLSFEKLVHSMRIKNRSHL